MFGFGAGSTQVGIYVFNSDSGVHEVLTLEYGITLGIVTSAIQSIIPGSSSSGDHLNTALYSAMTALYHHEQSVHQSHPDAKVYKVIVPVICNEIINDAGDVIAVANNIKTDMKQTIIPIMETLLSPGTQQIVTVISSFPDTPFLLISDVERLHLWQDRHSDFLGGRQNI